MFSILILTHNEETNLPECLSSIPWCDDIVILDSGSTDHTAEIARRTGCRVFVRPFDDFAAQRNYGIRNIAYRHKWVFHLDADERFTECLRRECEAAVISDKHSGYMVPSKLILWGKWLKHAATYPVYQMRFHKIGEMSFKQYGHGQRETGATRSIGVFREPYEHHSFGKGLTEWWDRHNRYSSQEASETLARCAEPIKWRDIFCCDKLRRRRALKTLSFHLPGRSLWKFFYLYIMRMGIMDGWPGMAYCLMHGIYEQMISLKVYELRGRNKKTI